MNGLVEDKYLATAFSQFIREVWNLEQKIFDPNLMEVSMYLFINYYY